VILVFETDKGISEKEFIFSGVGWFKHSGFPSPALVNFNYIDDEDVMVSGGLIEFLDSEAAYLFNKHYKNRFNLKHFLGYFYLRILSLKSSVRDFKL